MKRSPLRRTPMRRRVTDTGPDRETVMAVLARDAFRCVRCGAPAQGERGRDWSLQHRKKRSAGVDNRPCNLITLCGDGVSGCHGWVEANPARAAYEGGWAVSRYADPEREPVLVDRGSRWTYLSATEARYLDPAEVPL